MYQDIADSLPSILSYELEFMNLSHPQKFPLNMKNNWLFWDNWGTDIEICAVYI